MIDWTQLKSAEARATEALVEAKAAARAALAASISAARARYITTLPGQEMIYLAKEAEAVRFVADPAPDLAAYPLLSSELGITAPDAWQLAQIWLAMSELWRRAAAQLEADRLRTAAAIEMSASIEEVQAALASIEQRLGA